MSERCGYCGRFVSLVDYGHPWGSETVCSQQDEHIKRDPEHWSVWDEDTQSQVPASSKLAAEEVTQ